MKLFLVRASILGILASWPLNASEAQIRSGGAPIPRAAQLKTEPMPVVETQASTATEALMGNAAALFAKADYPGAIAIWTQIIMAKPPIAMANQALINRSKAYLIIGQPALALADLQACNYKPNQVNEIAELWLLKGTSHLQNKQYTEAIAALDQSQRLRPNDSMLYSNRSVAYQALGKIAKAKTDIETAIKIQPTLSNYFNLAVLYKLSGNPAECYNLLGQIIQKSQPYANLYLQRGLCAAQLGKHDDAIADMLRVLKLETSNVEAIQQLGVSLIAKNQKENAKTYLMKAASLRLASGEIEDYKKVLALIASLDQR